MRMRHAMIPMIKETPSDAAIVSHRLMLRAGMIRQIASGLYVWLPAGLRVLRRIEAIIRDEMDAAGAQEALVPAMQPASLWQESGRYDDYGKEMLRVCDRHEAPLLFGPTAEEAMTDCFRKNVVSRKQLPMNVYQISWKFRDEIRPRFGVMRGREFLMKDAYSFDEDADAARSAYHTMFCAYVNIFRRLGLCVVPVKADSGAIGGDLSHEFHVLAETGESEVFYDKALDAVFSGETPLDSPEDMLKYYTAADDMHNPEACPLTEEQVTATRGIEVGHIFYFGTKYTESMGASLQDAEGKPFFPHMGSYGIGVSRLVAAIIEASHDDKGIIWPESVAPWRVSLINIRVKDDECTRVCDDIYHALRAKGVSVLYDDTEGSAGKKFAAADLLGIPLQIRIGPKKIAEGAVEIYHRRTGETEEIALEHLVDHPMFI